VMTMRICLRHSPALRADIQLIETYRCAWRTAFLPSDRLRLASRMPQSCAAVERMAIAGGGASVWSCSRRAFLSPDRRRSAASAASARDSYLVRPIHAT